MFLIYHTCDNCGSPAETRVFEDSWTGKSFCIMCLTEEPTTREVNPLRSVTMSPEEDGDNLADVFVGLKEPVET